MQEKIDILGVPFDRTTLNEAVEFAVNCLKNNKKGYICTPNPEMLLEAEKNKEFLDALNKSLLNIPDGIGILWAATQIAKKSSKLKAILNLPLIAFSPKRFKKVLKERVTGTDLLQVLCKKVANSNIKVFLLGASSGIAKQTAQKLQQRYSGLNITGTHAGSPSKIEKEEIISLINKSGADLLFVAYGAPKQELWIEDTLKDLETIKIAIGVGGAFDFISGKRKRAPKWMQKIGLEWLFRLIQEPSRWKRIYNATVKFPLHVIKHLK